MKDAEAVSVLDLGAGSGAVACAIAWERPECRVTAVEKSEKALAVARRNAERLGLSAIRLLQSDWFSALPGGERFSVIVSNPPYIKRDVIPTLSPEVARHEPVEALDGGPDGLDSIRAIIGGAPEHLEPDGFLIFEMGFDQKDAVAEAFAQSGRFGEPEFVKDYAGHFRVARASLAPRQ